MPNYIVNRNGPVGWQLAGAIRIDAPGPKLTGGDLLRLLDACLRCALSRGALRDYAN